MTESRKSMSPDEIRTVVRDAYGTRAGDGCCGPSPSCCEGTDAASSARRMGYSDADIASAPEGANLGLGCGTPLDDAAVVAGEAVLDLGSGAGFDAFIAARTVGSEGRVIGVDMTPEMVAKARANADTGGHSNVEFREGLIEDLPVADGEVDVVISNCVINLSPDKAAVFRDAFRVLRPGGRLAVSDIVLTRPLPEAIADSLASYVGCVAGASTIDDYLAMMRDAGFEDVRVVRDVPAMEVLALDDPVVEGVLDGIGVERAEDLGAELQQIAKGVRSARVVARRPTA